MKSLGNLAMMCALAILMLALDGPGLVVSGQSQGPRPAAQAGPDQQLTGANTLVHLDGSESRDVNGRPLTYRWTLVETPAGSSALLAGADTVSPSFLVDQKGQYRAELVVNNGLRDSVPDSVTVTLRNTPPVANAGGDQNAAVGQVVHIDGTASTDGDGDALEYQWTLLRPSISRAELSDPSASQPTFLVDKPGQYTVRLVVRDTSAARSVDTMVVTVPNTAPVANAGPDQPAAVGTRITLDGSESSDIDGDGLRYTWTLTSRPLGSAATLFRARTVHPFLIVDVEGQYVAELRVSDGLVESAPDTVVIGGNSAPIANAGPDQHADPGQIVHLDGTGSTDANGDALTYLWTFASRPAGSSAALDDPAAVTPTFTVDRPGTYRVQLVVNDGVSNSTPDVVQIMVGNPPPVADAGIDQRVEFGATVTLDGSGSTDVNGDELTYIWSLTSVPDGSAATLSNPAAVMPTFVADAPGTYVAQLIVSDGTSLSAADTVTIETENVRPVAGAGAPQTGRIGQTVTLDGSSSFDVDGDALRFSWSFTTRPAGSTVMLTGSTTVSPSFVPDQPGEYVLQLIVNDGRLTSEPDTVTISTTNSVPQANAGPGQVDVPVGGSVALSGLLSSDPDGQALTYRWSLLARPDGSAATLDDAASPTPAFIADVAGDYVAQLIVSDGIVDSAPDTVMIRTNRSPVAAAGPDQAVAVGATVQLDGGSSTDPDGETLTYAWSFGFVPPGSVATLSDETTSSPTFVADLAGDYLITLTITNESGESASDAVTVTATAVPPTLEVPPLASFPDTEIGSSSSALIEIRNAGTVPSSIAAATATGDFSVDSTLSTCTGAPVPAGQACVIRVIFTPSQAGTREGLLTIASDATSSPHVVSLSGTGTEDEPLPTITVQVSDAEASEVGPDNGAFVVSRSGSTADALTVNVSVGGTATNGTDYTSLTNLVMIPAGQSSTTVTVIPRADSVNEGDETVILSVQPGAYTIGSPSTATVVIADNTADGGTLINGANHTGVIATAGEVDTWTFTASAGETIAVSIGETGANSAFVPWIRLLDPNGTIVYAGNNWGALAAQITTTAPLTGTYRVLVASADSGNNDTGSYVLTSVRNPGTYVVSPGDEGGSLTNGGNHSGTIHIGDLDAWTFAAVEGETVVVSIGEVGANSEFQPWIRVYGPTGPIVYAGNNWGDLAAQVSVTAPVTGTYTVLVSTGDSGSDAAGSYVLTAVRLAGTTIVSPGDQGGALSNGGNHTGIIGLGDLDPWTLTATAGETIVVNIGETGANSAFQPWIRIYGPTGVIVYAGNNWGDLAAQISVTATATGNYTVLVSTGDSGSDATGAYVLTAIHLAGPVVVSPGDECGALTNGGNHTGTIGLGDFDPWTLTATAGETIVVNIGETGANSAFQPWIRIYGPTGVIVYAGNNWGDLAAQISVTATATGNYTVLVSTGDSGNDATGTYVLTAIHLAGSVFVSPGDEGGALTNGGNHTGTIALGDFDPWTLTATAGETIVVNIGETGANSAFQPWIRIYGPTGVIVYAGNNWGDLAAQIAVTAPATGNYTIVVSTGDSGNDATGSYVLTAIHLAGGVFVSPGDEGGALTNGGNHTGSIGLGDFDAWTLSAMEGETIVASIGEVGTNTAFQPWIRIYGPTGVIVYAGNNWGDLAAQIAVTAPATGNYTIVVSTGDSGNDATGSYVLTAIHLAGAVVVSPGDEGGALSNGGAHSGFIGIGDLDAWTFSAVTGQVVNATISETGANTAFQPWIRIYGPTGVIVYAGNNWGDVTAAVRVTAPATGSYTVVVSTGDSGNDAPGTYALTVVR